MYLSVNNLSTADNDKNFYRLFFFILGCINIIFHFLYLGYQPQAFDPVLIRLSGTLLCFITILLSFLETRVFYNVVSYATLIVFLAINNCYFLGSNNFSPEYFFGSIISLLLVNFFCRQFYEFIALNIANSLAFGGAFFFNTMRADSSTMTATVGLFTAIAFLMFLFRKSYVFRVDKINNKLNDQQTAIELKNEQLQQHIAMLQSIAAANTGVIFEYNEHDICTNVWCRDDHHLAHRAETLIGTSIYELKIPFLANTTGMVIKTLKTSGFEFQSLFDDHIWYYAVVAPVLDYNNYFTGRVTITIANINTYKLASSAVKENELILFNEQVVAKIGSWWADIATREISWSNNLFALLEVADIPDGRTKLNYYVSLIHPDDKERAQHYFSSLAHNPLHEFEHRLITPKGSLKYFKVVSGYPVTDDEGNVTKVAGIVQDITESVKANKIIRKSQLELMEVQAIAKIGGWKWEIATNSLIWSDEIYNIYELDKENVQQENHFKLLLAFIHPDDKADVAAVFKTHSKFNSPSIEYRIITPSGKLKYLSLIIGKTIEKDGAVKRVIGTLQDLTDLKKIEKDFERSENEYKKVLENINLAAVTLNKEGSIVFCNKHLANIVGYDKGDILGISWIDTFVPENLKGQFRTWLRSNSFYTQHTSPILCKDGSQRIISWKNTVTLDEFGQIVQTTSIGEDITDVKKAREALIIAKESAEKSSKFKSEFLSIMSHEIRTPMNAVIGTTNLLIEDNPAPGQLEYLKTLQYSSNNLLELINDILDYNKIEAGKLELYKSPFNISELVHNIAQSFGIKAQENASLLKLSVDSTIPINLIGDQLRLGQILNNLLSNAVKFTNNGTILLNLQNIEEKPDKVWIKFIVADTGIGIAPENQDKIFDPFTQEDQSTQANFGGTGLGLAITKRLVELHNSTISLTSSTAGTEFSFSILFDKAQVSKPSGGGQPLAKSNALTISGMYILLVDDNEMNLMVANKFLKKWGAIVEQATNGKIAVDMAMANNYDLILMDLQMPVMGGLEASSIIKQTQPDLPIIALSADAMPETIKKTKEYGMNDYLSKPFVPSVLLEKIARFYNSPLVED